MGEKVEIKTAATILLEEWKAKGRRYDQKSSPFRSLSAVIFEQTDVIKTVDGDPVFGVYTCAAGTSIDFFTIGLTETHPVLGKLTDADTNIIKGFRTNGAEDVAIMGVSASPRQPISLYDQVDLGNLFSTSTLKMLSIQQNSADQQFAQICDPASILLSPQLVSPLNLENVLYEQLSPVVALRAEFNRESLRYITELGNIPEGVGRSYNRAHGEPNTGNRYRIPEGWIWRGSDGHDSEFAIRGVVTRNVAAMISAVTSPAITKPVLPKKIILPVQLRLHGVTCSEVSKN